MFIYSFDKYLLNTYFVPVKPRDEAVNKEHLTDILSGKEDHCTKQHLIIYVASGGEGNGTPLQYSCLENPMDGGAWEAAVHGVVKSRT